MEMVIVNPRFKEYNLYYIIGFVGDICILRIL